MSQFQNPLDAFKGNTSFQNPVDSVSNPASMPPTVDKRQPSSEEETPIWDTADAAMAVPRGLVGGVKGIYNTADWLTADVLPDWNTNPLGESRSIAGGLIEGLAEFSLALIPGNLALGAVGAAGKAGRLGAVGAKGLGWLAKGEKLGVAGKLGRATASFAAGSFIMTTPGQERLSNLALQFDSPLLNNEITQFLASDEDEGQLEARLKAALESVPLTLGFEAAIGGIMQGVKAVKAGMKAGQAAQAAGASVEEATAVAAKTEAEYAAANRKEIEEGAKSLKSQREDWEIEEDLIRSGDAGAIERQAQRNEDWMATLTPVQRMREEARAAEQKLSDMDPKAREEWRVNSLPPEERPIPAHVDIPESSTVVSSELQNKMAQALKTDPSTEELSLALQSGTASRSSIVKAIRDGSLPTKFFWDMSREPNTTVLIHGVEFGGSVDKTVDSILKMKNLDPGLRAVAEFLGKTRDNQPVTPMRALPGQKGFEGNYNPMERVANVLANPDRTPDQVAGTALHEIVHSRAYHKIEKAIAGSALESGEGLRNAGILSQKEARAAVKKIKDPNVRELFNLYDAVLRQVPKDWLPRNGNATAQYGLENIQEFLAEAFTNSDFQKVLAKTTVKGGTDTLWERLVNSIGKILGIEEMSLKIKQAAGIDTDAPRSALDMVIWNGANIMRRDEASFAQTKGAKSAKSEKMLMSVSPRPANPNDASLAGRGTPKTPAPIPNVARPDPIVEMRPGVEAILTRVRNGGSWTAADVAELENLMQTATTGQMQNFAFGNKSGTQTADFMLAFAEMVNQNKELYEGAKRVRTNRATADARDEFLSTMAALGGMNDEQKVRFAKTIADWHGPQFEDGAAITQALLGAQVQKHLEAFTNGSIHGEKSAIYETLVSLGALDRKISNIVGRTLQNRKMAWKEELSLKISAMGPDEVAAKHELLKSYLDIGIIDKETFFRIRDNGFLNAGGVGIATWTFKNSILSGVSTSAINAMSGIMSHLYLPAERALGEAIFAGMGKGSMSNAARELRVYRGYLSSSQEVWNSIKASWRQEGDSITLGSGNSPYGEFTPRRPVSADNPAIARPLTSVGMAPYKFDPTTNKNQLTVFGSAIEWFGKLAGMPTRVMGTIDETLSVVYARAEAREVIADAAPANIRSDKKLLAQFVEDKMKSAFDDVGALYSEDAVRAQIMRQARSEGFTPGSPEWTAFVQNQMAGRWTAPQGLERENMEFLKRVGEKVRRRTEYGTFKRDYDTITEGNTFAAHTVGQLGKAASGLIRHVPAAGMILPFVKTPTNLAAWALERNPTAAATMLKRQWDNPEMRGEVMGRLAAGTVMYGTMLTAAMAGTITGRGPNDPNVRKALIDSGWQPNSLKVGDTYISYSRLDPFATMFGMVADMVEIANHRYTDKEFENASDAVAKVSIGMIANNLVNKTYLAGLKGSLDAITNWEQKGPQFLRQYAASVVPNFMAQSTLAMSDDMAAPRSALDAIRARIPGLGDTVDRQRNSLGEAMENTSEPWNMAIPIRVSNESRDPVRQELARLLVGFAPPDPQLEGGINLTTFKGSSGQSAYDRYQELTGSVAIGGQTLRQRLGKIIGTSAYQAMPETSQDGIQTSRVGMLRGEIGRYRREAMRRLQGEFTDLNDQRNRITSLKAAMSRGK